MSWVGIDWLFWSWVVVTVLLFLDLIIPDPIPFIDEAVLLVLFFILLGAMTLRGILSALGIVVTYITHPVVLSFAGATAVLIILDRLVIKKKGGRKR